MYNDKRISDECNAAVQAALEAMQKAIDAASHGVLTDELRQILHDKTTRHQTHKREGQQWPFSFIHK